MITYLQEATMGSITTIRDIAIIVFPLMIVIEFIRDLKLLDHMTAVFRPMTRFLGVPDRAALPLGVGLVFGLAYGAGVIIDSAKEGELDPQSLLIISLFLAACHAVFEDTLLFVAIGVNGFLLLGIRLLAAILLTFIVSKFVR